jgi:hypothetical protein
MKTNWKFWVVLATMAFLPWLSGCVAALAGAAGAGTVAWVEGRLDSTLNAKFDDAAKAAGRAIKQLQFALINEQKDALGDKLTARTAEDKKIEIKVIPVGDLTSQVQIRVGIFGDEHQSLVILDKIKQNL